MSNVNFAGAKARNITYNPPIYKPNDGVRLDTSFASLANKNAQMKEQLRQDKFERQQKREAARQEAHEQRVNKFKKGAIAIASAALVLVGGNAIGEAIPPSANYETNGKSYAKVAVVEDIDVNALLLANHAKSPSEVKDEIILPVQYQFYGDDIAKLKHDIEFKKLTQAEREALIEQLEEIEAKQKALDDVATVYTDEKEKRAYIIPNDSIDVEEFKEIFGIKDGVLKKYNDMPYVYVQETQGDVTYGYYDYTNECIPRKGVVVPFDEIKID